MAVPLPIGPTQYDYTQFGLGPGDNAGAPIWTTTLRTPTPSNVISMIAAARTFGITVVANLAGSRGQWCDQVGDKLHFNRTKFEDRVKRFVRVSDGGTASNAVADAVEDAFADKVFIAYIIDEWYHTVFDGTISDATANSLGLLYKQFWPGCITFYRTGGFHNMDPAPAGGWTGADYGAAWYTNSTAKVTGSLETPAQYWTRNKAGFATLDIGMMPGFNWVNSPDTRLWDHDNDSGTADRRVWGDLSTDPGRVVGSESTTNRFWLLPPDAFREMGDVLKLDLDAPLAHIWLYPGSDYVREAIFKPYWIRSDFVAAQDYLINACNSRASWTGWRTSKGSTPPPPPPPASEIDYAAIAVTAIQSTGVTTYTDIPGASLAASEFTTGHKYLIIAQGDLSISGVTNGNVFCRTVHGSTAFDFSENVFLPFSVNHNHPYQFATVWTAVGGEGIKMQFHAKPASNKTVSMDNIHLLAIDLDTLPANSYFSNRHSVSTPLTTSFQDGGVVTFTPDDVSAWLVITCAQYTSPPTASSIKSRLETSGGAAATDPECQVEDRDATNDIMLLTQFKAQTLTAVSHTFKEQSANSSAAAGTRVSSEVIAINLSQFAAHAFEYDSEVLDYGDTDTAPYETQAQSTQLNITATSPIWILTSHNIILGASGVRALSRMQLDNGDSPATQTVDEYEVQANDNTDVFPLTRQHILTVAPGIHTVDLDSSLSVASAGRGGRGRLAMIARLAPNPGPNDVPVWQEVFPITVNELETIDFTVVASDTETTEANLVYSLVTAPPQGAVFDPETRRFVWTPNANQAGVYNLTFRVADEADATTDMVVDITVVDIPTPIDFRELRNLRYDNALHGGRIDLEVSFNGSGNADKKQGITGVEVVMTDLGRI